MANKVMDDVTRRRLMGLLPFAPDSFARVTPKEFDVVEVQFRPVFYLRAFSSKTMSEYRKKKTSEDYTVCDSFRDALSIDGCIGWENYFDLGTGEEIKFSPEAIMSMTDKLASALFSSCLEFTYGPTQEEKTGLESLPPPTSEQ